MSTPSQDRELFELLDAYLDGELQDDQRAAVDGLLERSAQARTELAEIERVRSLVRGLPPVDAPFGFYERLVRRRTKVRGLAVATVGAVAAAIVLVLAISPVTDRVAPPVVDLGERHAMLASARAMPADYEPIDADATDGSMTPPPTAGAYRRMAVYDAPEGVHAIYDNGVAPVSVFEQTGDVDWDDLPVGGERMRMDGDEAWMMRTTTTSGAATEVVVMNHGSMVVTVVGTMTASDAVQLADAMPRPGRSLLDRAGDACEWVAEGFGFPR